MLIVKEPVKLKSFSNQIKLNNLFQNKILANYNFMMANIKKEDLLYLLMGIQEREDGIGMTMLTDNISISNQNDIMINYINQTINRILNMNSDYISYQDRIFISCALRNMGIYNVNQFIKNILKDMNILELKDRLLKLYERNLPEKTIINYNSEKNSVTDIKINEDKEYKSEYKYTDNFLFKNILKKLYYIESNKSIYKFTKSYGMGSTYISHNQLVLAEQYNNAKKVDLITKRYDYYGYDVRLDERTINPYEMINYDDTIKISTLNSIMTDIVQSALFHIIKMVNINSIEDNYHNKPVWTEIGDRICNTINNSLERFKIYHTTGKINNTNFTNSTLADKDITEYEIFLLNNTNDKCIIENIENKFISTSANNLKMMLNNIEEKKEDNRSIKLLRYLNREVYEDIAEEFVKEYSDISMYKESVNKYSAISMDNKNISEKNIISILKKVIDKCIINNASKCSDSYRINRNINHVKNDIKSINTENNTEIKENNTEYIENKLINASVNQLEMVLNNISQKEEDNRSIKLLRYINREVYEDIAEEFIKEYSDIEYSDISMDKESIRKEFDKKFEKEYIVASTDSESITEEVVNKYSDISMENKNISEEKVINILKNVIDKCLIKNASKCSDSYGINFISASVNQLDMVLNNISQKEDNRSIKLLRYINREVYEDIAEEFVKEYSDIEYSDISMDKESIRKEFDKKFEKEYIVTSTDSESITEEVVNKYSDISMENKYISEEKVINILKKVIDECLIKNASKWSDSYGINRNINHVKNDIKSTNTENNTEIKENNKEYIENKLINASVNQLDMVLNNISQKEEYNRSIKLLRYLNREVYEDIEEEFVKEYSDISMDKESIRKEFDKKFEKEYIVASTDSESITEEVVNEYSDTSMENKNISEEKVIYKLKNVIDKCLIKNASKWSENYSFDIISASVNQLDMVLNNISVKEYSGIIMDNENISEENVKNILNNLFNSISHKKIQNDRGININVMLSDTNLADIVYKVDNKEDERNTFLGDKSNSTTYVRNIKENHKSTENSEYKNKVLNYNENNEEKIIRERRYVELQSVVKENIQKEIRSITEQVYNRIEKKLQNEKKRRGI